MKWLNKTIMAVAALCVMAPWNQAGAVSGTTDMTINFPEIVYLHYVPYLELTFTGSDAVFKENAAKDKQSLADKVEFDAQMQPSDLGVGGKTINLAVVVHNVWAVRGITKNGEIRVVPKLDEKKGVDTNGGQSAAYMDKLEVVYGSNRGDVIDVPAPGLGYKNAVKGDIAFNLDIEKVTRAGAHKGFKYTITATPTP